MNNHPRNPLMAMACLAGLAVGVTWACPVVQNNESPAGPTPVYDVQVGKRGVDGNVVVAGGGGMSAVQVTSTGQAQSAGLSGGTSTAGTVNTGGEVQFKTALATTTGTVTSTSTGQLKVTPTAPVVIEKGELYPVDARGQTSSGRYITGTSGSAPGTASFTGVSSILMDPGSASDSVRVIAPTSDPNTGTIQIFGSGLLKDANGAITGGAPVSGAPPGNVPLGPELPDANVRYDD